jgi:hypothetical protein
MPINGDNKGRGGAFRRAHCIKCHQEHNLANLAKHYCFGIPILDERTQKIAAYYILKKRMLSVKPRFDIHGVRIEWRITPQEMLDFFDEHGVNPEDMGAKMGGVNLCRFEDIGHYEIGNVYFDLHENNGRDQKPNRKAHGAQVFWGNQFVSAP